MPSIGNLPKLYIVCDTSGSMMSCGKKMLMRSIVRTVEQYVRLGYATVDIKLVRLNSEAKVLGWNPDDEFPNELFECKGTASLNSLSDLLGLTPDGKILFLTDGCWSKEEIERLRYWNTKLSPNTIRIIKIGNDITHLRTSDNIFCTDDIFTIFDNWFPEVNTSPADSEEDEW